MPEKAQGLRTHVRWHSLVSSDYHNIITPTPIIPKTSVKKGVVHGVGRGFNGIGATVYHNVIIESDETIYFHF